MISGVHAVVFSREADKILGASGTVLALRLWMRAAAGSFSRYRLRNWRYIRPMVTAATSCT